jgi:membrane protein YqaA with SNARE-associated domain
VNATDSKLTAAALPPKPNVIRRLYDWVISWAQTPYGVPALVTLAFLESSVFPIPPDVLLLALALSVPTRAFRFAAWCTLGSVLGGVLGYFIGSGLWHVAEPLMYSYVPGFSAAKFERVKELYNSWGVLAVFVAAFTPIPYKVFTIAAGVFDMNLLGFMGASIAGRGGRFFLVALVIRLFGDRAKQLLDKHFNLVTLVFTVLLVGSFLLLKLLR